MKRASDVPPSVANSGSLFLPVAWDIDLATISLSFPGLFKKDRPLISWLNLQETFFLLEKKEFIFSSSHWISDSAVCWSLKRMFILALAYSGITLLAGLPTSIVGIWIDVGKKNSLPSSSGVLRIFEISSVK